MCRMSASALMALAARLIGENDMIAELNTLHALSHSLCHARALVTQHHCVVQHFMGKLIIQDLTIYRYRVPEIRYLLRLSSAPICPKQSAVLPWVTDQDAPQAEALPGIYFRPVPDTPLPYRDQTFQASNYPDRDQRP